MKIGRFDDVAQMPTLLPADKGDASAMGAQCARQRETAHYMTGANFNRSIDTDHHALQSTFLQNKPCHIVLRKCRISMPNKTIIDDAQI